MPSAEPNDRSSTRLNALIALVVSLELGLLAYVVLRIVQHLHGNEPDPLLVVWQTSIALFWRIAAAVYVTLALWPVCWVTVTKMKTKVVEYLPGSVIFVTIAVFFQALLVP